MNRLKGFAIAGLIGATIGVIGGRAADTSLEDRFKTDAERYGAITTIQDADTSVTVTLGASGPLEHVVGITGNEPNEARDLIDALEAELASNPGFYTQRCGLTNVRIIDDLKLDGTEFDGAYSHGVVYLNTDTQHPRTVVVHELNHLCVDKNLQPFAILWNMSFNRRTGTEYVGERWRDSSSSGFSRSYGSKSWFEDVATISEDLILHHDRAVELARKDMTYAFKAEFVSALYRMIGDERFKEP